MNRWQTITPQPDQLGESPFWHPDEQQLYWADIPGRALRRMQPDGGREPETWPMPQEPGCFAPARSGGFVIALRDGIYRANGWGGPLALLHRADHDPATTRFNDGKADVHGRFWAGTIFEPKTEAAALLLCLDARGDGLRVERMAGGVMTANGLAWSPAGDTLYWADTQGHCVRAWDWDARANVLANERVFHQFEPKPAGWKPGDGGYGGRPDGAAVDTEGCYWCAMYEGGRVVRLSPRGELLESIETPVLSPTMPCFGGANLRTLYLTAAKGCVLSTTVPVPGLPVNFFID
jgi:sugar lactone lactonase YvrE